MLLKNYLQAVYGVSLNPSEEAELLRFLQQNASSIKNVSDLQEYISKFMAGKVVYIRKQFSILNEACTSDLEQAIKVIQRK